METSSLRKNRPHLEAVLGPLSAETDAQVRLIFDEVDEVLHEIARHFDRDRAGWEGTGLELTLYPSGQMAISSHVGACTDSDNCVDFCIELRPSWYFGEKSSTLTWEIETEIWADYQQPNNPTAMKTVYKTSSHVATPLEAALVLRTAVDDLLRCAMSFSLEHWLELASERYAG